MASATLSVLAGSLLSPLRDISLEKLISYLWDYLLSSPSSPDEAEKQQQLKDSLKELEDAKLDVKLMRSRIMRLFKKHKQNERVVRLHNKLKDVGYDIQDLESDMKYMQLEREVQEINKADQEADTSTTQSSGKRSFQFRLSSALSSKKKRRLPASSQSLILSTDEDIVRQVTSIIKQIKSIESRLKDETTLEEWFDQIKLNGVYDPWEQHHFTQNERVTTSSTNEREIYGRKDEIQQLIEFLKGPTANNSNVSIAPIVGMGGMGKTTLAQFVFNHTETENNFDEKGWIFVSDHFDRFRIIKEMVDIICPTAERCSTTNLDVLERQLKRHLIGKKFLLVLDDVWSDEWQQLLVLLQSTQAQAIKIIVTCRDPTVLRSLDQRNRIILRGIDDEEYWLFFIDCASAQNNPELHDIGRRIVEKLMGSPLAAKTVGKLLGCNLIEEHWNEVLENDLWKLKTDAHDIMPALALSYYHLSPHLQPCFTFCSVLRKCYPFFEIDELVSMWIANGYVSESGSSSKTMNDIGKGYCDELLAMCFFDEVDPTVVKMHDLMHDLAQLVSHGETCTYESEKDKKISKNVRHFCAKGLNDLGLICKANNLRTLLLPNGVNGMSVFISLEAFNKIRVLVIHDEYIQEFPNAFAHLKHLQYLDLSKTKIKLIPESLCGLYQLRVLKLCCLQTLPSQFHKLINLEILHTYNIDHVGRSYFPYYRKLQFHVKRETGFMVAQLRNMNKLRGPLVLKALENINNREEATKAKLKEKGHMKMLDLRWNLYRRRGGRKLAVQEEVLEGLEPHPNLEELKIKGYMGSKTPSWLMKLQKLKKLHLSNYRNLACLPSAFGLLQSLTRLELTRVNIESFASNVMATLHALQELYLLFCNELLSVEGLQVLPSLKVLSIHDCRKFRSWCTEKLTELQYLSIGSCQNLESLPDWLHSLHLLWGLYIADCSKFNSPPNGGFPSSLQKLSIIYCDPGLIERCQQVGSSEWQMIQHISEQHLYILSSH